jgi:hypothetical protein
LIAVLLFMTTPATLTRIFHDLGYSPAYITGNPP